MHASKKILYTLLRLGISAAILTYIFTHPDMRIMEMLKAIKGIPWHLLFIGIVCYGFVVLLGSFRWFIILKNFRLKVSYPLALKLNFIGLYFNNMMPSLTGGDIIKAYYTAKGTHKKMEAVASIFLDRVIGVSAVMVIATIGAICVLREAQLQTLAYMTLIMIGVFFLGAIVFLNKGLISKIPFLKRILCKTGLYEQMQRLYYTLVSLTKDRKAFIQVVIISLIIQLIMVMMNYFIALGLGLNDVALIRFFVFIPIASIISALPISFAGWGIGEGAYNTLFKLANPNYGVIAVALSIVCRLILLAWSLIGLPIYLLYRHIPIESIDETQ